VHTTPTAPLWPRYARRGALDVVGVGQISLDRVHVFEADEPPQRKLPASPGGQVATAVLALTRLGLRTAYVGAVGADADAGVALTPLCDAGVDCSAVKRVSGGRTRSALIRVERGSGERSVEPRRDPRVALAPGDLPRALLASARALHLDTEDPAASAAAAAVARAAGLPVVLDADRPGEGVAELLRCVDFPIASRDFAEQLAPTATEALERLAVPPVRLAVVTLGAEGAVARAPGETGLREVPVFPVVPLDTTGAGDAFRAGFLYALLAGGDAGRVLRVASAVGALNCRASGAQGGLPDRRELEGFLAAQSAT
jgi:sulfofructose kinase